MKNAKGFKAILSVLALTLVIFGGWRLLNPAGFYAFSGAELSDDAGALSEAKGAGGVIIVPGSSWAWARSGRMVTHLDRSRGCRVLPLAPGRLLGLAPRSSWSSASSPSLRSSTSSRDGSVRSL